MLQTINYILLSVIGLILMSVVLSELVDSLTNKKRKK
jgi:hypothetical protein